MTRDEAIEAAARAWIAADELTEHDAAQAA